MHTLFSIIVCLCASDQDINRLSTGALCDMHKLLAANIGYVEANIDNIKSNNIKATCRWMLLLQTAHRDKSNLVSRETIHEFLGYLSALQAVNLDKEWKNCITTFYFNGTNMQFKDSNIELHNVKRNGETAEIIPNRCFLVNTHKLKNVVINSGSNDKQHVDFAAISKANGLNTDEVDLLGSDRILIASILEKSIILVDSDPYTGGGYACKIDKLNGKVEWSYGFGSEIPRLFAGAAMPLNRVKLAFSHGNLIIYGFYRHDMCIEVCRIADGARVFRFYTSLWGYKDRYR